MEKLDVLKKLETMLEERHKEHCFHLFYGAAYVSLPDGYVLEKCCLCDETRSVHIDHQKGR